jgi:predicted dehydrogenase
MSKTLGIGVCGAGIGRHHIMGYQQIEDVQTLCIAGPDVDRCRAAAKEFDIPRVVSDYRDMLAMPDIDAVSVCVPNVYHHVIAVDALKAGKHLLCEKPLATNACEAQCIVDAARANDRILMVDMNNRFSANARALKTLIDEGTLGPIHFGKATWLRRHGIPGFGGWFTTKSMSGGGPLIDIGVHMLDLALYLMGFPEPVSVMGSTYNVFGSRGLGTHPDWIPIEGQITGTFDVEDLAVGMVKLANGATLMVEASWAGHQEKEDDIAIRLYGQDGGASMLMPDYQKEDCVRIFTDVDGKAADFAPEFTLDGDHARAVAHFVECIREGKQPLAAGEQGVTLMRIIDALYKSAATGREVRLDEAAVALEAV